MEPRQFDASVLHRVSGIVSSELSLDEMLGEVVGLTARVSGCDACLVYLVESETGEFVLRASLVPHARDLGNLRMKMGEGVTGWVAEHQSPVALSSNATSDTRFKLFPALIEDTYEAFLSVPLVNKGKAIGVVLPDTMDLTVIDTEPTVQKATASAVMKAAKLETGLTIQVPPFVNTGDKVRVDTSEARYVQRV